MQTDAKYNGVEPKKVQIIFVTCLALIRSEKISKFIFCFSKKSFNKFFFL